VPHIPEAEPQRLLRTTQRLSRENERLQEENERLRKQIAQWEKRTADLERQLAGRSSAESTYQYTQRGWGRSRTDHLPVQRPQGIAWRHIPPTEKSPRWESEKITNRTHLQATVKPVLAAGSKGYTPPSRSVDSRNFAFRFSALARSGSWAGVADGLRIEGESPASPCHLAAIEPITWRQVEAGG